MLFGQLDRPSEGKVSANENFLSSLLFPIVACIVINAQYLFVSYRANGQISVQGQRPGATYLFNTIKNPVGIEFQNF